MELARAKNGLPYDVKKIGEENEVFDSPKEALKALSKKIFDSFS